MQIGFIGLGLMGTPIVLNLRKAGYEVRVWNRTQSKAAAALDRARSGPIASPRSRRHPTLSLQW